jgi:hypothetical protein
MFWFVKCLMVFKRRSEAQNYICWSEKGRKKTKMKANTNIRKPLKKKKKKIENYSNEDITGYTKILVYNFKFKFFFFF